MMFDRKREEEQFRVEREYFVGKTNKATLTMEELQVNNN
jgi:hypothetical protein